ncbi:MAG: UvrD-helicase domain-containing protein [Pirellulales bacterium]|nr:UvrD-helicase domain-containing protein [Pirellulales bacterium]
MNPLLENLTPAQRDAVTHLEGPLLVLAGPGSGKTRVVTHRIAYLMENDVYADEILALTFTNKAAEEMKNRVEQLSPGNSVWVGTFHRFCARLLRKNASLVGLRENYTIHDTDDTRRVFRRVLRENNVDTAHFTPDAIASAISWAKNSLIGPEQYKARPGHALGEIVSRIYPAYQAILTDCNAVDFDDLLMHVACILRDNPDLRARLDQRFRFVLVDEYQDTNLSQYAIARALSVDHPNLAVTGDPDQSIYGWRGANLRNILDFERDFPSVHVVRLERNYRSTKRILEVAAELIRNNVNRKEKTLYTENGEGQPVRLVCYVDQKEEARQIAARIADDIRHGVRRARDFAIFYRVNALSRAFELALREVGVPFQLIHGLEFFQRREIKDILSYLYLLANPQNDMTLLRVINTPARGIGKTTIERVSQYAARSGISLLEAARRCGEIGSLNKRAVTLVGKFVAMFDRLSALVAAPIEELLGNVLEESGYQKQLEDSDLEEDQQRLANIEELLSVGREFDEQNPGEGHLEEFLEETSLVSDTDDLESETDRVTLMTLHASKGLEFPVVYFVAVEEGLIPHERSSQRDDQLEEERRLMFVGITRAQEELQLSRASYRDFRGRRDMTVPSQFLMELPRDKMELAGSDAIRPKSLGFPESWNDLPPEEMEWKPDDEPAEARAARAATSDGRFPTGLTTAAEMANGTKTPPVSPEVFHQNMIVRHPEYGLGHIIALSGSGANRKATVDFGSRAGRKSFVLRFSKLQPVRG